MNRRGFTLLELMIGLAIGAVTVVVASSVAQMLFRQAVSGRQQTDFNSRTRTLGRQLRADIRAAGIGSTGAVFVNPTVLPWLALGVPTTAFGGYPALPVIRVSTNVVAGGTAAYPGDGRLRRHHGGRAELSSP